MAITFEDVMKLSNPQKLGILGVVIIIIILLCWIYVIGPAYRVLDKKDQEYTKLEYDLNEKKKVAEDRKIFETKLENLKIELELMKSQLPDKKEIPNLLKTISSLGKESGLQFLLFRPKSEIPKDFYAEIPVELQFKGDFHEVATFFSNVGNLDRIINIGNVTIDRRGEEDEKTILNTSCLATTFRFIETTEVKVEPKAKGKKPKARKNKK